MHRPISLNISVIERTWVILQPNYNPTKVKSNSSLSDQDPTYDYFILETISELQWLDGDGDGPADGFYTKLKPYYSNDTVRAGGPASQGGTTLISINFYPPSIGFSYAPGSKTSISSTSSLSNNYFEAYYNAASPTTNFVPTTIHRTDLSYRTYAPSSQYTYTRVNITQKVNYWQWSTFFDPWTYYYDY